MSCSLNSVPQITGVVSGLPEPLTWLPQPLFLPHVSHKQFHSPLGPLHPPSVPSGALPSLDLLNVQWGW